MRRSALPLAAILVAVVVASCGARPGVTVTIDGQPVPMVPSSTTERVACRTAHGDGPPDRPLTTVRLQPPVIIRFAAGPGATRLRGWIYDTEAPRGGPIEEFTLPGRGGSYEPREVISGRTYDFLVNAEWSFVVASGEETHAFRLRIEPP